MNINAISNKKCKMQLIQIFKEYKFNNFKVLDIGTLVLDIEFYLEE